MVLSYILLKYVTTVREVKIVVCNNRPRPIHIFPANHSFGLEHDFNITKQQQKNMQKPQR